MERAVNSFFLFNFTNPITEDTILVWLASKTPEYTPTSLWTMYSLVKKYLLWKNNVDLGKATLIQSFLKTLNKTHKKKKAPAFTRDQIFTWLARLTTPENLWKKICTLLELYGTLRTSEALHVEWKEVQEAVDGLIVAITRTKTDYAGEGETIFVPTLPGTNHDILALYHEYRDMAPVKKRRFFLNFSKGISL
jgi:hypothetical protein